MSLILSVIRCPDSVAPERREVTGGEFTIGRGPDNDWVLADPDRHLSKRHCRIAFRSGAWQLSDTSSNGTFVNHAPTPIGPGADRTLRDGDRITLGTFEIEVRIAEPSFAPPPPSIERGGFESGSTGGGLSPGMLDPFGEAPPPPRPFGDRFDAPSSPPGSAVGGPSLLLPDDFDPLAPAEEPFQGPTQPDHAPALNAAFQPRPSPFGPMDSPPGASGGNLIPDDWDLDLPASGPSGMAGAMPPPPVPPTIQEPIPPPAAAPPPPPPQAPPRIAPAAEPPPRPTAEPYRPAAEPYRPAAEPYRPTAEPPMAESAPDPALLLAFLRGTGLGEQAVPDPAATLEAAGAALRAAVSGLRQALIARASIKGEFRIEQTMIRTTGNNPLKFSAGDDDALLAMLGIGRRDAMRPDAAMADALRDMRLHELATVTAMQAAVRALLARFDPAALERGAEKGGFSVIPGGRKARAWEAFEALHAEVSGALADNFDSVFGKSFAKAYEQAMEELSSRREIP